MKFKYLAWLIALIIAAVICSCSSRKTNLELVKTETSHESELKIDVKEATLDKGIIEKLSNEKWSTIKVLRYFGQLPDSSTLSVNHPIFEEITYSNGEIKTSEKENKDLASNKAVQATEKKKDASVSKVKNKQVENTGMGTGKVIGISIVIAAFVLAFWFIYKQVKKVQRLKKLKEALLP